MSKSQLWYAGRYTDSRAEGIVSFQFDPLTGRFTDRHLKYPLSNPSWLTLTQTHLFAISEDAHGESACSVFTRGPGATLNPLDRITLPGTAVCHADVRDNHVVVSCYVEGWSQLLTLENGGLRTGPRQTYTGRGPHPRQSGPHAHQATWLSSVNRWLVCDLGSDRIWVHDPDFAEPSASIPLPAGSGPRHLCPDRRPGLAWIWCELEPRLFKLEYGSSITFRTSEVDLSEFPSLGNGGSAIHLHPHQPWLAFASRSNHTIHLLDVTDAKRPRPLSTLSHAGRTPRDFRFDPTGRWLLSAAQDEGAVHAFEMNTHGHIQPDPTHTLETGSPSCLVQCTGHSQNLK